MHHTDPLAHLSCPVCAAAGTLHSPVNGYSACWCGRCGAHLALHTSIDPTSPGGLNIQVAGVRPAGYGRPGAAWEPVALTIPAALGRRRPQV